MTNNGNKQNKLRHQQFAIADTGASVGGVMLDDPLLHTQPTTLPINIVFLN
jgi:hypothetical protein